MTSNSNKNSNRNNDRNSNNNSHSNNKLWVLDSSLVRGPSVPGSALFACLLLRPEVGEAWLLGGSPRHVCK